MSSSGGGGSGEEPVCRLIGGGFATLLQIILGFAVSSQGDGMIG
jgi:hypothetical protein